MRVGVLTSVHPPNDTRILFKEAVTLVGAGHHVALVARSGGSTAGTGVEHHALPVPRNRAARILTAFKLFGVALRLRCDVYHLHDPELLPIGVILKWITKAAIVFDVHEDVRRQIRNKYWVPRALRRPLAWVYDLSERFFLRWVDRVVVAEDSYITVYSSYDPIPIRNYPVSSLLQRYGNSQTPRAYSSRPLLVYCGTIARIRGAMEMVEAVRLLAKKYPDVHLSLIGSSFPVLLEAEIREFVGDHSLTKHVTLHGRLRLDDAMKIVSTSDIGLALLHPDPNYLHSLPTKMFEYMALRLPVVVSDFGLWRGIVDATGAGITVDPLDPSQIASAIDALVCDRDGMARRGEYGSRAVRDVYSWDAEGGRLAAMYAKLARDRGFTESSSQLQDTVHAAPEGQVLVATDSERNDHTDPRAVVAS